MAWKNRREVDVANQHLSNIYRSRGRLDGLGAYLCAGGIPASFMISGGADPDENTNLCISFWMLSLEGIP